MEQFPFNIVEFATIGDSFDEEDGKNKTRPVNGNFLFTDFRAPLPPPPPLFKIARNSKALNTSSYDIARRRSID